MSTLHMMIGIQGSGKTTYTKRVKEEFNAEVVSSDRIRTLHPDWEEAKIFPEVYRLCAEYLKKGIDVVADSTSITPRVRTRYIESVKAYDVDFEVAAYFLNVPYEVCYERVSRRNLDLKERFLPLDVIVSYMSRMIPPTIEEGFKYVRVYDQVDDILLKDLVIDKNQGYALYFKAGNSVIEKYNGKKIVSTNDYINRYTNFRLASVTKQFIARAIVQLVNDGLLSYDTLLIEIYPELPECFNKVKIINMLNHTSGIPNYEDMTHGEEQILDEDVLCYLYTIEKLYFNVGEKYQYSNTAYVLLGLIIEKTVKEKLSGEKFDKYIEREIFKKVGMTNSFVNHQGTTNVINRAYGHKLLNGEMILSDQYWCSATIGDGGFYSSIDDLIKWLQFLRKDDISKQMFVPNILPNGKNSEYGLGIRIVEKGDVKIIYHCGETIGTNTIVGFLPDLDMEFIFLTNMDGINCSKFIGNLLEYLNVKEK